MNQRDFISEYLKMVYVLAVLKNSSIRATFNINIFVNMISSNTPPTTLSEKIKQPH